MSVKAWMVVGAVAAFTAAGPLQHIGAIPATPLGDASKATLKAALNAGTKEALACNFPGRGNGNGHSHGGWRGWLKNSHLGDFVDWLRDRRG